MYLWLKLLHIFFVVSWFAGLFYLPRIFVNLAQTESGSPEAVRLTEMAQRLLRFMTPLAAGTLLFGLLVPFVTGWWGQGWLHGKVLVGALLLGYHLFCRTLLADFIHHRNRRSHRWFRVFNEVPVLLLFTALYLVLFKPF